MRDVGSWQQRLSAQGSKWASVSVILFHKALLQDICSSSLASSTNMTEVCSQWVDLGKLFTYDTTTTGMYVADWIHTSFLLFLDRHNWACPESSFYFFGVLNVLKSWKTETLAVDTRCTDSPDLQMDGDLLDGEAALCFSKSLVNKRNCMGKLGYLCACNQLR